MKSFPVYNSIPSFNCSSTQLSVVYKLGEGALDCVTDEDPEKHQSQYRLLRDTISHGYTLDGGFLPSGCHHLTNSLPI